MKVFVKSLLVVVVLCMAVSISGAADPELTVKADLELFYESSKDVASDGDSDKFKSNQLYIDFLGKFDNDMEARVLLDGADVVGRDNKTVSEKIIEEANFTMKGIGGGPVTVVFGKDEMPFGLDYDKHLNDSISHQLEIDKVWGLHGILDIPGVGSFAAATYQHRHSLADGQEVAMADNRSGDNYSAKLTLKDVIPYVELNVSGASESYSDLNVTDSDGTVTLSEKEEESRLGAGMIITCPKDLGNINLEYITFSSLQGMPDYDPSLITAGVEYNMLDNVLLWGRYEIIDDDTTDEVENDFWSIGVAYSPADSYTLCVEYSNFNSGDMSDATDLNVAKGSIEDALLVGVKASF